jgi:hypothetical protein
LVVSDGPGGVSATGGFYDRYISPSVLAAYNLLGLAGRGAKAAGRGLKRGAKAAGRGLKRGAKVAVSGLKATGRGIRDSARAAGRGTKWTYKNVLAPAARLTGRVAPPVGRFARDDIISPTYRAIRDVSPKVGRFAMDYFLSPVYQAAKRLAPAVGSVAYRYIAAPIGMAAASRAKRFHDFMMGEQQYEKTESQQQQEQAEAQQQQEQAYEEELPPMPHVDPAYYCVNPYDRSAATIKARRQACSKGGNPHPSFADQRWANAQLCSESCNY